MYIKNLVGSVFNSFKNYYLQDSRKMVKNVTF